jgi:hypothetical protein
MEIVNESVVADAIRALGPFRPTTPRQATDMLLFWVRRRELTDADMSAVTEAMFPGYRAGYAAGFAEGFLAGMAYSPSA